MNQDQVVRDGAELIALRMLRKSWHQLNNNERQGCLVSARNVVQIAKGEVTLSQLKGEG